MRADNRPLAELLLRLQGIDISAYEDSFLNQSLHKRFAKTRCNSIGEYCIFLEQNVEEARTLKDSLRVGYSEFFRNSLTYSVLENILLPSIALNRKNTKRKEIRIWTAACAAGQESYSLAMLMEELKHGSGQNVYYRIFATDQNEAQVNLAVKGCYAAEALNCVNMRRTGRWFHKHGDAYTVMQELKENIDFSVFDLSDDQSSSPPASIFGDFDLVVCANLLFYYNPGHRKKIIDKAVGSLAPGGFLMTGETERDFLKRQGLVEVFPHSAIFQIKV